LRALISGFLASALTFHDKTLSNVSPESYENESIFELGESLLSGGLSTPCRFSRAFEKNREQLSRQQTALFVIDIFNYERLKFLQQTAT